jgi:sugar phosphate isomerase/epimerase
VPAVKIAIQLANLRLPLRKGLAAAARLGASGVEIDARGEIRPQELTGTALRELRRLLDDHDLRVSAVGFHTRRGYDVPDEIERRVAATKAAMKMAADLRAPVVVNQVGRVPDKPEGAAWNLLVQSLADLSAYGQHVGALLAAQTGTESGVDLARLIAALPEGGIGVDLDPGNLIINGFSPLEAVESLAPHILHVHARDAVRDLARGRGLEVALGRGTADFPALLGALEDRQYRGYFTIAREESDNPEFEIGEAVKYLRNL